MCSGTPSYLTSKAEKLTPSFSLVYQLSLLELITNEVTFVMGLFKDYAVAKLKIDRTKFDVKYGSASFFDGLKDRAIYDEFDLDVKLKF